MAISEAPSLLETARLSRGLTQAELAAASGVAQGVISKFETNSLPMDEARISALASALDVPAALIDGTISGTPHARVFHRKQASLPAKAGNRLHADMVLAHLRVARLLENAAPSSVPRMPLPHDGWYTPSDRARELRATWGIPSGPIENMVDLLEAHGVPCLERDVTSARVDAISSWPDDGPPVVLLSSHAPADRLRFTIAHELGHAVLHEVPCADCESQADDFASEFLMPASSIRNDLAHASLPSLAELKRKWGVSIAALARRARDLGAISESQYRSLNIELSAAGMRKSEPVELTREQPTLIARAINARLTSGASLEDIASAALIDPAELQSEYMEAA